MAPEIRIAYYSWVHRIAHILANEEDSPLEEVRRAYRALLAQMLPFRREVGNTLEGVMNSAEKPHWDADSSVSSVLHWSPVFHIGKLFLSEFITPSSNNFAVFGITLRATHHTLAENARQGLCTKFRVLHKEW
jgi:hypothetical protein